MASTHNESVPELDLMDTGEHHQTHEAPTWQKHKRGSSHDTVWAGSQFSHISQKPKKGSWPLRPPEIELDLVNIPDQSPAGDLARELLPVPSRLRTVIGLSSRGSRSTTSLVVVANPLYCSKEDAALLRENRDRRQLAASRKAASSVTSTSSTRANSPSMSEGYDVHTTYRAPTQDSHQRIPPPRTPSPQCSTNEGASGICSSVVGESPYSSLKRKRAYEDLGARGAEKGVHGK